MTNLTKALAAGLMALVLPVTLAAQEPNARAQDANNAADEGQNQDRFQVLHALNKAIAGSDLQFAAQFARGGRQQDNQGQDGANRQDRRDDNPRTAPTTGSKTTRARRPPTVRTAGTTIRGIAAPPTGRGRTRIGSGASRPINSSPTSSSSRRGRNSPRATGCLTPSRTTRGPTPPAPTTARNRTRRIHTAVRRYTDSLRSLAGVREGDARASASSGDRGQANADQNRRNDRTEGDQAGRSDQNRRNDRTEGDQSGRSESARNAQQQPRLNRGDVARVFLINHAVRQATEAYFLDQWNNRQEGNNANARGGSNQRLRERTVNCRPTATRFCNGSRPAPTRATATTIGAMGIRDQDQRNQDRAQGGGRRFASWPSRPSS